MWLEAGVPVWGTVPERVGIAAGPDGWLSTEGLDYYGEVLAGSGARCAADLIAAGQPRGTVGAWT